MTLRYIVMTVGCLDCEEETTVHGIFTGRAAAVDCFNSLFGNNVYDQRIVGLTLAQVERLDWQKPGLVHKTDGRIMCSQIHAVEDK